MLDTLTEIWQSLIKPNIWFRIAFASILLVVLLVLSLWQRTKLETKLLWNFLRGFIQIILFGSILSIIFAINRLWLLYLILVLMCLFAAYTNARSYRYPRVFLINLLAITTSSLVIMTFVIFSGVLPFFEGIIPYPSTGEYVIPMGSMVIAFAMRVSGIALERAKADILKSKGLIEAALALGDTPTNAIQNILRDSYKAGLIPTINRVGVLGIVTIPGLMAGMIIGGVPPIEAAIYQVVIFLMLLSAAFLSSITTNRLFTRQFFTKELQFDLEFINKLAEQKNNKKQEGNQKLKKIFQKMKEKITRSKKKKKKEEE